MKVCKCKLPGGVDIRPDGLNKIDPCRYRLLEIHKNVTVNVSQCQTCGHVDISWKRQDDTESAYLGYILDLEDDE